MSQRATSNKSAPPSAWAFTWFGTRKSLTAEQKSLAADAFGATGEYLSAGKKLVDTGHKDFKALTRVRYQATQFWKSLSLPFPEPGIRLIRRDDVELFDGRMSRFKSELDDAVETLQTSYGELK